jgi:hypothetical protein
MHLSQMDSQIVENSRVGTACVRMIIEKIIDNVGYLLLRPTVVVERFILGRLYGVRVHNN